jgi:ABC-type polysaccharide transport system permease subunit
MKRPKAKGSLSRAAAHEIQKNWGLYLLVLIPVAYLILFRYVPMYGAQIAFRDYKPTLSVWESPWAGMKHINKFFSSYQFWQVLRNTIAISLYSLATFPLPIIFALMLNYLGGSGYRRVVQMFSYAPYFISVVVMVGILIQFLDTRSGVLNHLLGLAGIGPINFLGNISMFRGIYVWSDVWQSLGYNSIIFISALAGISPELHEAATVDGASIPQRIWHIDIPGILPTASILLILRCGNILNVGYEKIYLMQNTLNLSVSEIINTYVYKQGLQAAIPQYSYSAAIGLFVSVVNFIMLLSVNRLTHKMSGSSLW